MGNIHLGKEITVINMEDAGDPFGNLKAIADDLKQSFGGLNAVVDDTTQTVIGFNDALCQADDILRGIFINDISLAGQQALMLGNTMQTVNNQFQAFLQTFIQSGFLQQIEQLLLLTGTEIGQLNQTISGQLMPAIALLTQDAIIMAKSGGGGDSILGTIDHIFSIANNGFGLYKGVKGLFGKGGASEGIETKGLLNPKYLEAGESDITYGGLGGYTSTTTATEGAFEYGASDITFGSIIPEVGAGVGTVAEGASLLEPVGWAALIAAGLYEAFSKTPYQGEQHPVDDYVQHGVTASMAHVPYIVPTKEQIDESFKKRYAQEYQDWSKTASYEDIAKAQAQVAEDYHGISLQRAFIEGFYPQRFTQSPEDEKATKQSNREQVEKEDLASAREEIKKQILQGLIPAQNAPKLETYKDLIAYKNKWQPLSPMFSTHGMGPQFPALQNTPSKTFNIHVEFHDTYNNLNDSVKSIHDKIVEVLTNAVYDSRIGAAY